VNLRAVLFDLDGTLVDSLDDLTAAVNHMLSGFGKPMLTVEAVRNLVGKGARNLVQRALDCRSAAEIEQGLSLFTDYNAAHIADVSRLYPGVSDLLEMLAASGTSLAVISNKGESLSRQILTTLNIDRFFRIIAGGDTFEEMKPSPLPLLRVMDSLAVSAAETVMVGDSINDIQAGNLAGVQTIACNWGYGTSDELSDATVRVSSCRELSAILSGMR
jgi:phosphoglycolate phosphatase